LRNQQAEDTLFIKLGYTQSESGLFPSSRPMHSIIYLVGLIVVVMFMLSLLGLH